MVDTERRAVVAAVVSLAGAVIGIGGAGHAYLREWGRAFAWFSLVLGAGLVLVGSFANPETATLATLPLQVTVPVVVLLALNTVDAYYVARRGDGGGAGTMRTDPEDPTVSCPSCGRDLDPELSFCPWCAGSRNEAE
ncbi:zinc ribbon domain-containing protein [Haloplanus litoreus]|uniref:Zinc ribbon domain-containing protein n=1 Tax=Haloplanus litoreus TaxID=767515 RepID=A0ABD6A1Y5_9EURY